MDDYIRYKDGEWLKEKDLLPGKVYLIKDGRLMLYIGRTVQGEYVFYVFASSYLVEDESRMITFGNYRHQIPGLLQIINNCMSNPGNTLSLLVYRTLPKIHGEFTYANLQDKYAKWYTLSFSNMFSNKTMDIPIIASFSNKPIVTEYVKSKDLIPGHLYYSGQCWRATYLYVGRKSNKEYVWYFIGNERELANYRNMVDLLHSWMKQIHTTRQIKKVKPLASALNDKNAYVSSDTKKLIEVNYRANMDGVTQQMIDML